MAYRPAQVYTGSTWDDIGDKRMLTHNHGGGANGANIPQSSVTDLTSDLAAKLDLAGGKILQIVRATDVTQRSTTSTSLVDASLSVTITPQKSDSAVLLVAAYRAEVGATSAASPVAFIAITDSSNNAISGTAGWLGTATSTTTIYDYITLIAYATPATTSATTYKTRFAVNGPNQTITLQNAAATGQLYAIEVSA